MKKNSSAGCARAAVRFGLVFVAFVLLPCLSVHAQDIGDKSVTRTSRDNFGARVALVVGNKDYKQTPLQNPANDAEDFGQMLKRLGFSVTTKINVTHQEFEDAIEKFSRKLEGAEVGLFYFSGHGCQARGENYLLPIDREFRSEVDIRHKAIGASFVLAKMEEVKSKLNIMILDACRTNTFVGDRAIARVGLCPIEAPVGTFMAYATAPGSVASDAPYQRNGVYTKHLLKTVETPGLSLEQVFKITARGVQEETNDRQIPWTSSSLTKDFYFSPWPLASVDPSPLPRPMPTQPAGRPTPRIEEPFPGFEQKLTELTNRLNWDDDETALSDIYKNPRNSRWFFVSAEDGNVLAQLHVGNMYTEGLGVEKSDLLGVKWLRKAAEQGHALGQYWLGHMYYTGAGVPEDKAEAARWYRRAADMGWAPAMINLGFLCADGRGVEKDQKQAVNWYRRAADQGHPTAQYWLGYAYDNGLGVAVDKAQAINWFQESADKGNSDAMVNLGVRYSNGADVVKDEKQALIWISKAAERGNADAMYNLGLMRSNGRGVARDEAEAVKWFLKAAEKGNSDAMCNLGVRYSNGTGVARDEMEAVKWYRKAADQGNVSAMHNLGVRYAIGAGVARDDIEAKKWYRKAIEGGEAGAQAGLDALVRKQDVRQTHDLRGLQEQERLKAAQEGMRRRAQVEAAGRQK